MQFALSPAAPLCFGLYTFYSQLLQSTVVVGVAVVAGRNKVVAAVVLFAFA